MLKTAQLKICYTCAVNLYYMRVQ